MWCVILCVASFLKGRKECTYLRHERKWVLPRSVKRKDSVMDRRDAFDGRVYAETPRCEFKLGIVHGKMLGSCTPIAIAVFVLMTLSSVSAFADTTAMYTAGVDMDDGKVAVIHDGSGNIVSLSLNPANGETLTLTGDTLSFAANAVVSPGGQINDSGGVAVISNLITTAGALEFVGMTNMTWVGTAYLGATGTTLFENVRLNDIEPVSGYGKTGSFNIDVDNLSESSQYLPYNITRHNESTMTFELQRNSDTVRRGAFIELTQDGNNIYGRSLAECYKKNDSSNLGKRMFNYDISTHTATAISSSGDKGYQDQKVLTIGPRHWMVTAIGANTMTDSAFVVKSDATHPIVYNVAAKYAMPPTVDFYGNATLNFSVAGAYNDGASKGTDTITMHAGTTLTASNDYPFHYDSGEVVLDGATMSHTAGTSYLNYMTLMNGATVDSSAWAFNAGYTASNPKWTVGGTVLSTYSGNLALLGSGKGASGGAKDLTVEVEDVGDGTDFLFSGDITVSSDRPNATIVKTGAGTMEINGTLYTTNRAVRVSEGTLLLGKSGATVADAPFSLRGGTLALAAGTANAVAAVELTDDSAISVASGASLTMAGLTIPDGSTLNITYAGEIDSSGVKVSTTLDSATLSRIRLNGRRAAQNDEGYLCAKGFIIFFH